MRKTTCVAFVFAFSSLAAIANSQNATVKITESQPTIEKIIEQIEEQTDYLFVYSRNEINTDNEAQASSKETTVKECLDKALKNTNISYSLKDNYIVLKKETEVSQQSTRKITGVVLDANGETVIGANVVVKGTTIGTVTDFDGKFSLDVPSGGVLGISYIGYVDQDIDVANKSIFDITLRENVDMLDELVVVGFGTQKKVNLSAAVSTIDSKQLTNRPVSDLSQALQGISPGLNVTASNAGGALNQTSKIDIRGTGTIGEGSSSSPLVLIDGVEGDMSMINQQDVQSISILKDAGAAAIYGSRAAFGVILITTKSGIAGRTVVNYNNSLRWSTPTVLPTYASGYETMLYANEACASGGIGGYYPADQVEKGRQFLAGEIPYGTEYDSSGIWKKWLTAFGSTEWYDVYFKDWSFSQEHNISLSGGSEKSKYYISGMYQSLGSDQNYGNEDFKRYSLNAKINTQPWKWLKITSNTRYGMKDYQAPSYQVRGGSGDKDDLGYYHSMARRKATDVLYTPDGILGKESQIPFMDSGGDFFQNTHQLYEQLQFLFQPLDNWTIVADANMRLDFMDQHKDIQPVYERKEDGSLFAMARDDGYNARSMVEEKMSRRNYFNTNVYTTYTHALESGHTFTVTAGFQAEVETYKLIRANRDGLISMNVPDLGNTTSTTMYGMGSIQNEWATSGFFGRINYDYKGRYLAEVNYRYDGSSRFLQDQRWKSFPSFSLAWNIAREGFMEDYTDIVSLLKIRPSYGSLGNQNTTSLYPFYSAMDLGMNSGGWLINYQKPHTAKPGDPISPLFTWERVESYNLGLDFGMFRNRLTGSLDYFNRITKDMVGPGVEIPNTGGVTSPKTNNAKMRTVGWDLLINWQDRIIGNKLGYEVGLVLSDNQSEVLSYPNETFNLGSAFYTGKALGEIWGYEANDIARTEQQMQDHLATMTNGAQNTLGTGWGAGDVMYNDLNGDGKIDQGKNVLGDSGDKTVIGNSTPRYNFGLTLAADYEGFDFRLFFQGTMKRDVWLTGPLMWGSYGSHGSSAAFEQTMDYFRPTGTDSYFGENPNGYLPRPLFGTSPMRNYEKSSLYLQNAAYVRLKNLQLGYTLPKGIAKKLMMSNFRLYISAENLFTISGLNAPAFDPELLNGSADGEGKASPLKATVSFGLSLTF